VSVERHYGDWHWGCRLIPGVAPARLPAFAAADSVPDGALRRADRMALAGDEADEFTDPLWPDHSGGGRYCTNDERALETEPAGGVALGDREQRCGPDAWCELHAVGTGSHPHGHCAGDHCDHGDSSDPVCAGC